LNSKAGFPSLFWSRRKKRKGNRNLEGGGEEFVLSSISPFHLGFWKGRKEKRTIKEKKGERN